MARKRKNGQGTVRLRKDGRWEGRQIVVYDENGKAKTKSVLAKTKAECLEKLKQLQNSCGTAKPLKIKPDMRFGDWIGYWYETHCRPTIRPTTQKSYEEWIYVHVIPGLGHIHLNKLTQADCQKFLNEMKANGRKIHRDTKGPGMSERSVRSCYHVIRMSLERAIKDGLIKKNPILGCKLSPPEQKEMKVLSREEIQRFLLQAKAEGMYELFLLELTTGLRRGELLALRWDDLNVKDRILSVSKQITRIEGELVVTEPKTKNSVRKVALSQQAVALLVQEHEQHPDSPLLFPSPRTGGYWSPDAVSRINRKLLAKAGIEERVRFHDLHHTFATMALSSGVDVKTLSSMLGHYSAGFTLDTYTHITNDMQRGAAEKIGGFMETATAKPEPEPPDPPEESRCKVIPFERVG